MALVENRKTRARWHVADDFNPRGTGAEVLRKGRQTTTCGGERRKVPAAICDPHPSIDSRTYGPAQAPRGWRKAGYLRSACRSTRHVILGSPRKHGASELRLELHGLWSSPTRHGPFSSNGAIVPSSDNFTPKRPAPQIVNR